MDSALLLQHLCSVSMEEGRAYIQAHSEELADHTAIGILISDHAIAQLYNAPFVSLKLAELLIFFSEYVHHAPSHALGLNVKGNALRSIGHHQRAVECLDAAGEEFLRLGDEVGWARTRTGWILSAAWLGRTTEALQVATQAREAFLRHGEYYRACTVDHNTAMVYTRLGRYQDALELYERMLAIYPTLPASQALITQAIAIAECNQASNFVWLGKFEQAYHLLQKAKACLLDLKQLGAVIIIENNLAELDYAQGYYGSAIQHYYQALDALLQNEIDDPFLLAQLKLWMANCLVKLNRVQEACQSASEAVEACRKLGVSLDLADALRQYATTLVASAQPEEALAALDEASTLFARGGFEHYANESKLQLAEVLLETGTTNAAYSEACLVKEYFDSRELVSHSTRAGLVMVGTLIERIQQAQMDREDLLQASLIQEAVLLCKQVAFQAHQYNLQEQTYKVQHFLGRLASLEGNFEKATRHYAAAIAQVERILDNLVHDLSPSFLHTTWAVFEDMIALCLEQGKVERAFSYLERARSVVLRQYLNTLQTVSNEETKPSSPHVKSAATLSVQREIEEWQQAYRKYSTQLATLDTSVSPDVDRAVIETELKLCESKLSELFERLHLQELGEHVPLHAPRSRKARSKTRSVRQIDVKQLRQNLAPDQLLLAYFLCNGKLIIFAITAEQLTMYERPDGVAQLEHLLLLLNAYLQPGSWPDPQRPPQQAIRSLLNMLYDLLIAPIVTLLPPPSGYLTIVPYGPLHNLPFHALFDGSHFLVEDYQINYLPASSILPQVVSKEGNGHLRDGEMSSPIPAIFGYSGNGHIRRAVEEAKSVASLLGGRCYLEDKATITRLIEQAPLSSIIHVATHGQSRLDAPNFSSILLADGQLNALDAFSLNLKECELVTLSGCETGLALSGGGDEQLGLGRAFLAAGASSLVMSLWPVEDTVTSELMQFFYQGLLRGDSKVQALRAAQCAILNRTSSMYAHPYFWAAFRLVGDAGPLNLKRADVSLFAPQSAAIKKVML